MCAGDAGKKMGCLHICVDCGLSCLSMVLNTLEVDPGRKWKGIWRWFSEEMLSCCAPLSVRVEWCYFWLFLVSFCAIF